MTRGTSARRRVAGSLLFPAALLGFAGCQTAGPHAISEGRALYAEVINRTGDEQVLNMIVRNRYDETFGMLDVASVTSQVHVGAAGGVEAGVGPASNYAGNLVPFSAALSYEESPTIAYVPLSGEEYMTRLVAPVSLSQALTLGRLVRVAGSGFRLMVNRINGLSNASGDAGPSPGFERLGELLGKVSTRGIGNIVLSEKVHYLSLRDYSGEDAGDVRELLDLLQLTAFEADGRELLIPIRPGLGVPSRGDAINLETRSVLDLVRLVGDSIEVPAEDLDAGFAERLAAPRAGEAPFIRIRSSREHPADAMVAIAHRGWWFYIDSADTASKRGFVLLRAVINMGLAGQSQGSGTPVLTLPVG